MLDYKKVLKNTTNLLKENKLIILLVVLISFSGILFFGNILSNYNYFFNHKYFISFTKNFSEIATIFQSFIYNSIIANTGESITTLFSLNSLYSNSSLINKTAIFGIITFVIVLIMFFITNILSIFVIYSSKKQKITEIFKETKSVIKNVLLLDLFKILFITVVFGIMSFISIIFSLNSYLFIIISFTLSGLLFFVLFFVLQYSLRYIIFFKKGLIDSLKNSFSLFFNNLKENILSILLLIIHLIILFTISIILFLPIILLNFYFIHLGYLIFNDINNIFINILIIIIISLSNLYIIKYLNELFGNLVLKNK